MAWRMYPCPNCGRPWMYCTCRKQNEDLLNEENDKIEMNIQCYAVPEFYIYSSNDPTVIPKAIEKINNVLKEFKEIYWDFVEDIGIELNIETIGKGWHKLLKMDEERRKAFYYASHLNQHLHDIMAPLFIIDKFDKDDYSKYMDVYENAKDYFNMMKTSKEVDQFYIDVYFDTIKALYDAVSKCFENVNTKLFLNDLCKDAITTD